MTEWRPDTCDCIIEFDIVAGNPVGQRVVRACSGHPQQANAQAHFSLVHDENRTKNRGFGIIAAKAKAEGLTVDDFGFRINANREIVFKIISLFNARARGELISELAVISPKLLME